MSVPVSLNSPTQLHARGDTFWMLPRGTKIILVANTSWYLLNFRRSLIESLLRDGVDVVAVCPQDEYVNRLQDLGVRWIEWNIRRNGMQPWHELLAIRQLVRIYRQEKPHVVNHFTIKAVLYGTTAARGARVRNVVNNITGLGHIFLDNSLKAKMIRTLLRPWYSWALVTPGSQAILQNRDDLAELMKWAPPLGKQALLTNGSGVDLQRFAPQAFGPSKPSTQPCIAFIGRLIAEKGVREFVRAAELCHSRGIEARFVICGQPDHGNPSAIDEQTLQDWRAAGVVELLGHVDPIEQLLRECTVVVLPSYREGTPKILLEAAAMGKPVIATDVPGCRDAVIDGKNGLLVPVRDASSLADAIQHLASDKDRCQKMGEEGRKLASEQFDDRKVVAVQAHAYAKCRRESLISAPLEPAPSLDRGVFLFSLDLELAWGTRGRPNARFAPPFLNGTRPAIRQMLDLFERYDIRATWAMVGGLLLASQRGETRHEWIASSAFDDVPAGDCRTEPHWYGADIVDWLLEAQPRQELACHTLTHLFVDPSLRGRPSLKLELDRFLALFEERYLPRPKSFIFPKAYMGHFDVLAESGFKCVRGPEPNWFESLPGTRASAAFRLLDATLGACPYVGLPRRMPVGLWQLPSSQFYSPFLGVGRHVSVAARVKKALKGIRRAVAQRKVFHLWTHPFNMGVRTDELMGGLSQILAEVAHWRDLGKMDILCMDEFADQLQLVQMAEAKSDPQGSRAFRSCSTASP